MWPIDTGLTILSETVEGNRGWELGVMGLGSLQEAGEKRVGDGILKGAGTGRNRK